VELPRGPHGLARELVAGSQRQRLVNALIAHVGEHGYAATSVADVVARAGVSRKTFYEHFRDKEDCFLAAYQIGKEALLARLVAAVADSPADADPAGQLRAAIHAYLDFFASESSFAASFMLEAAAAGPASVELRSGCRRDFIELTRAWYAAAHPDGAPPAAYAFAAAAGAADSLILDHIRDHGAASLLEIEPAVMHCYVALLGL
jgi:AcrR family transcriptional regulator